MRHSNRSRHIDVVMAITVVLFGLAVSVGISQPVGEHLNDWIATGLLALTVVILAGYALVASNTRHDGS